MAPLLRWLILFLSLLITIAKYTLGAILKWSSPEAKVAKDYSYQPTVSVILSCYNDGRAVYDAIESPEPERLSQPPIRGDRLGQLLRRRQLPFDAGGATRLTNIRISAGRNDLNSGKAGSVCNALSRSSAEIVISVDSDCIFDPQAIRELAACFREEKIGAVGGRVGVRNPNDGVITAIQTLVYYAAFH